MTKKEKSPIKKPTIEQRLKNLEQFADTAAQFINQHHAFMTVYLKKEEQGLRAMGVIKDPPKADKAEDSIVSDGATA